MVVKRIKELKRKFFGGKPEAEPREVNVKPAAIADKKMSLQTCSLESFTDTELILSAIRDGNRILLVKIRALREKDITELKRSINRIKAHCAATGGDMAAIDDNWVIIVPSTVGIDRS